ncbi:glycosyltransferase family 31 [Fusarium longipes]|uniref:Glycosyltransferase family 31 n=1 Tax=Fusarium longipes TaxID=694270 RepID=A0A395T6P8_9HYPO|nr:glycosyltransferase family 31 [Fusarium longipes]
MVVISRRTKRRLRSIIILLLISVFIIYTILPHDSAIRLAFVFNVSRFFNFLRGAASDKDAWLWKSPKFTVDLRNDVGYLIKTGYGTRHRVAEQLAAFEATGGYLGKEGESFLVVGDWTTVNQTDASLIGATVHDAIKRVMETKIRGKIDDYPRLVKYRSLQARLQAGDEEEALKIGQSYGWELDALKFIMGMEMIYNELPGKKWYIILDDDTFLIRPSLELLMGHIDYRKPKYIGNAVGDYKARFGHGGSGILISGEAMRQLFQHPAIVHEAYAESMTETWGDRLVATTLQKLGIYIEEAYNHHFNGEPPSITRIWGDRFCSPLVSFHGLRKPGEMRRVGETLAEVNQPVLWHDVWQLFGGSAISALETRPTELMADHVGKPDEHTRSWGDVRSANACQKRYNETLPLGGQSRQAPGDQH